MLLLMLGNAQPVRRWHLVPRLSYYPGCGIYSTSGLTAAEREENRELLLPLSEGSAATNHARLRPILLLTTALPRSARACLDPWPSFQLALPPVACLSTQPEWPGY